MHALCMLISLLWHDRLHAAQCMILAQCAPLRHSAAAGEELDKVKSSMARPGVLRSVALAPFSLVRGTVGALGRSSSKVRHK